MFYLLPKNYLVTISSLNGVPVKVSCGVEDYSVSLAQSGSLYWLSKNDVDLESRKMILLENKVLDSLDKADVQGLTQIVEESGLRAICIRIAENNFAILIDESDLGSDEKN